MTHAADDLEALFDEVAAHRTDAPPAIAPADTSAAADAPPPAGTAADTGEAAQTQPAEAAGQDASEKPMYERLGGIVRMLHDSLRELGLDRSLSCVADQITDAQGRLEYIASLTEQAANKVLNAVDSGMPAQESLAKKAKDMDQRWHELFEGKISLEEFKTLASDSKEFAAYVVDASEAEKARLLEIMMAQDFQDITGQLIKKIVAITNAAERELAQLLRDNAPADIKAAMAADRTPVDLMQGPSTPNAAMAQDDVDSLLADLGF